MSITIQDTASTTTSGQGGQSIVTGTPTTGSFQVWGPLTGYENIGTGFSLMISGTWTGTLTFEASIDNGVTFVPYDVLLVGTGTVLNSVTSNCVVKGNLIDITHLRVRATAAITGSATTILTAINDADFRHSATNTTGGITSVNLTEVGGAAIALGQTTMSASLPVTIASNQSVISTAPQAPTVTRKIGQVKIATTGTAVQFSSTSYVLQNGIIIVSKSTNSATGATIGASSVTNTVDGTGNGVIIAPGAALSEGAGVNLNSIYVNGTAGDVFSFIAS